MPPEKFEDFLEETRALRKAFLKRRPSFNVLLEDDLESFANEAAWRTWVNYKERGRARRSTYFCVVFRNLLISELRKTRIRFVGLRDVPVEDYSYLLIDELDEEDAKRRRQS
jgi:hypothetical protein